MARTPAQQQTGAGSPLAELETLLGHRFRDAALLRRAITHSSWVYETAGARDSKPGHNKPGDPDAGDNETLEFLGDAVLGLLAAEFLWRRFPARSEGELTQMRASVVSRRYLGGVGTRLGLGRWLLLGPTAEANQGRENPALFSNTLEALLAALYLDGGLPAARHFAEETLFAGAFPQGGTGVVSLDAAGAPQPAGALSSALGDWKSALKERLEASGGGTPDYRLTGESGPAHRRSFQVEVWVGGQALAEAEGPSKKQAQQEAARLALAQLQAQPAAPPDARAKERHG